MANQIELYLNQIQYKKYISGKAFQLTKAQIELNQIIFKSNSI